VERIMSGRITVGLLGFGEVGQVLADDLTAISGVSLRAYDTQFGRDSAPHRAVHARQPIQARAVALS
jgi:phosphoglycerate dehydrogenase-like enzyme